MGKLIIDAHSHLWLKQDTVVDGKRILSLKNGRSIFMDEEVQMLPPFMIDGQNTAEVFLSNMNYAQVGGAVVVQEVIDGCQNAYLTKVQHDYPNRFFCMGMAWNTDEAQAVIDAGLKGIAFPGHRIHEPLQSLMPVFKLMEGRGMVLSMCLADNEAQIAQMDHPFEKRETKAAIIVTIRDTLWELLPESYSDESIDIYKDTVFEYIQQRYGGVA